MPLAWQATSFKTSNIPYDTQRFVALVSTVFEVLLVCQLSEVLYLAIPTSSSNLWHVNTYCAAHDLTQLEVLLVC